MGESTNISESILNTLMEVFNEDGISDRQLVSERTINFIDSRFEFLAEELDSIEVNYQNFKEKNNLVNIASDASLGLEERTKSELELFNLEGQIELVKMLESSLNEQNRENLLPSNIGLDSQGINVLISEYNLAVIEQKKLSNTAGENNPQLKFADNTIKELKSNINKSLNTYLNQLSISKKNFQDRSFEFKSKIAKIPEKERLLNVIIRQQKIKESLYLLLLQKREEAAINLAITEPSIKIVEYALSNSSPVSPNSKMIYLGAIVIGLALPLSVIYIMFLIDTKVHTREDIEKVTTNIPILAEIPEIKKKGRLVIYQSQCDFSARRIF